MRDLACHHVDPLTEVVALDGLVDDDAVDRLHAELRRAFRGGRTCVVLDLRRAAHETDDLERLLEAASAYLADHDGGLAVVGGATSFPELGRLTRNGTVDAFADPAEALARVRGRLTQRRSVRRRDRRPA